MLDNERARLSLEDSMAAPMNGYVLNIDAARCELIQESIAEYGQFAEAVEDFKQSRNAPLVCFVATAREMVTHLATADRGMRAGTGQRRLNVSNVEALPRAVPYAAVDRRRQNQVANCLLRGGLLPPATFVAILDAMKRIVPESRHFFDLFGGTERRARIGRLSEGSRRALSYQKEAVATALTCADLDRRVLRRWNLPPGDGGDSFLDGLPQVRLREDPMVIADMTRVPGFALVRTMPFGAAVFEGDGVRLTVVLANRLPLEQQLGADLVYYNESYKAFVVVQYKAMEHSRDGAFFPLPDLQLAAEIRRMDATLMKLRALSSRTSRRGFRLLENPFFLKLCPRIVFNPDDTGLVKGMYLPLDYWRLIEADATLVGPRGGRRVTFENVGRYLDNTEFVSLVAKGWIGTNLAQSARLHTVIRNIIQSGRAMVLAVKTNTREAAPRRIGSTS
jgi:hypothetical protein